MRSRREWIHGNQEHLEVRLVTNAIVRKYRGEERVQEEKWSEDSFILQKGYSQNDLSMERDPQVQFVSRHHYTSHSFGVLQFLVLCFTFKKAIPSSPNCSISPGVSNEIFYLRSKCTQRCQIFILSSFFLKSFGGSPVAH